MQFLIKTKSLKLPQKLPATLLCAPWPFFLLFFFRFTVEYSPSEVALKIFSYFKLDHDIFGNSMT